MKNNKFSIIKSISLGLILTGFVVNLALAADGYPMISKEQLKELIDSADVVILDVRTSEDWQKSELKIRGAIRKRPELFDSWAKALPRGKTLVLY